MSQERYVAAKAAIDEMAGGMGKMLPEEWPSTCPRLNRHGIIRQLREHTCTVNDQMLVIGWGDGQAIKLLADDALNRGKTVFWLIMPSEITAFAHFIGVEGVKLFERFKKLQLSWLLDATQIQALLIRIFGNHDSISRLAGTTLLDSLPLIPQAEEERATILPTLRKTLIERFDCIGNDVYDTFIGAKHSIMHGARLMDEARTSDLIGRYAGKSAICLGSGPSAAQHMEHLARIQHEHVIIVADSFLAGCRRAGIDPDFVCMVERPVDQYQVIEPYLADSDTTLVALPVVHPSCIKLFPPGRVVFWWNADMLYPWIDREECQLNSGRGSGTHSVALAAALGCSEIYLVGHDLAYGNEGSSYANGVSDHAAKIDSKEYDDKPPDPYKNPNYYKRHFDVPGNNGDTVVTRGIWEIFRSDMEQIIRSYPDRTFINPNAVTGEGAVIQGCIGRALPEASGDILDKSRPPIADRQEKRQDFLDRLAALPADFDAMSERCTAVIDKIATWSPITTDHQTVSRLTQEFMIEHIVTEGNVTFFQYILRAGLRNCMVRLQQNTFVRTFKEKSWNQAQVLDMYCRFLRDLMKRLKPELLEALETSNG